MATEANKTNGAGAIKAGNTDITRINLTVLVDKSGSMDEKDTPSGLSRWDDIAETAHGLVLCLAKYDDDGVDILFFDESYFPENVDEKTFPAKWKSYRPGNGTRLAAPLKHALDQALTRRNGNPNNKREMILVITDGEPQDPDEVKSVIVNATHAMRNEDDVIILFLQSGQNAAAKKWLENLDNGLKGDKTQTVQKAADGLRNFALSLVGLSKTTTQTVVLDRGAKYDIVQLTNDQEIASLSAVEIINKAFGKKS